MRVLGVVALLLVTGCTCGEPPPTIDAGTDPFVHEVLPVHCRSSVPLFRFELLNRSTAALLGSYWPTEGIGLVTSAQAAVVSRDRGRSFDLVTADYTFGAGLYESSLAAPRCAYVLDENFWATPTQPMGSNEALQLNPIDGEYLFLTVVVNGHGKQLRAQTGRTTIGGVLAEFTWKYDDQNWLIRSNDWLYATRNAGGTLTRLRPTCTKSVRGWPVPAAAWIGDTIYFDDPVEQNSLFQRTGTGPLEDFNSVPPPAAKYDNPFFHLGQWKDRLVARAGPRLWVREADNRWTQLQTFEATAPITGMNTDDEGNLWAWTSGDGASRLYRFAPGQTVPTVIDFDFSPASTYAVGSLVFPADGVSPAAASAPPRAAC